MVGTFQQTSHSRPVAKSLLGDIIHFKVMQTSVIVINSMTIAHELLDKRSAIYSSRPWVPMAGNV